MSKDKYMIHYDNQNTMDFSKNIIYKDNHAYGCEIMLDQEYYKYEIDESQQDPHLM